MATGFWHQLRLLGRRSVQRTMRDPGSVAPAILIPLILFAVVASGLDKATEIPGFPTDNFTTFTLTLAFVQGAMISVSSTGAAITTDIETGFLDRIALTPVQGGVLVSSQLAGPLALGLIQVAVFFAVGLAAGADVAAGVGGALVIVALFLMAVVGFGMLGIYVGLRTASGQAVQAIAPLATVFLFLSSVNFPRNLIESDWFRWIATVNPISYLVEGIRSLLIFGWDAEAIALGFAVAVGLTLITLLGAASALRLRFVRT
jgi:ABC-2 type transport system permease protein